MLSVGFKFLDILPILSKIHLAFLTVIVIAIIHLCVEQSKQRTYSTLHDPAASTSTISKKRADHHEIITSQMQVAQLKVNPEALVYLIERRTVPDAFRPSRLEAGSQRLENSTNSPLDLFLVPFHDQLDLVALLSYFVYQLRIHVTKSKLFPVMTFLSRLTWIDN